MMLDDMRCHTIDQEEKELLKLNSYVRKLRLKRDLEALSLISAFGIWGYLYYYFIFKSQGNTNFGGVMMLCEAPLGPVGVLGIEYMETKDTYEEKRDYHTELKALIEIRKMMLQEAILKNSDMLDQEIADVMMEELTHHPMVRNLKKRGKDII